MKSPLFYYCILRQPSRGEIKYKNTLFFFHKREKKIERENRIIKPSTGGFVSIRAMRTY